MPVHLISKICLEYKFEVYYILINVVFKNGARYFKCFIAKTVIIISVAYFFFISYKLLSHDISCNPPTG